MCSVEVVFVPRPVDLLNLLEPLKLKTGVPLHSLGHSLRQVGLEAGSECASHASQQAVIRIERFKRLRVVLNGVV